MTETTTAMVSTPGLRPPDPLVLINVKEKAAFPALEPYLHRGLPDPPKSESPRPDHPVSTIVTARNNLKSVPRIQTSLSGAHSASL